MNTEFEQTKALSFLQELNESRLIPSNAHVSQFSLRDVADGVFLYLIVLYIMKHEIDFAPIAIKYINRTYQGGHFDSFMSGSTDLRAFLTLLIGHNDHMKQYMADHDSNEVLRHRLNVDANDIARLLVSLRKPTLNDGWEKRMLYQLEKDLHIDVSNYRSCRRLAVDWMELKKHEKQLVITRLLQAFRARFRKSELLPYLEQLAKEEKLEMPNAGNAETGEPAPKKEGNKFLKALAITAAGLATGLVVSALKKDK